MFVLWDARVIAKFATVEFTFNLHPIPETHPSIPGVHPMYIRTVATRRLMIPWTRQSDALPHSRSWPGAVLFKFGRNYFSPLRVSTFWKTKHCPPPWTHQSALLLKFLAQKGTLPSHSRDVHVTLADTHLCTRVKPPPLFWLSWTPVYYHYCLKDFGGKVVDFIVQVIL